MSSTPPRSSLLAFPSMSPHPSLLLLPVRTLATHTVGALKSYKPTTPGRRHRVVVEKGGLWRGRPEPSLTAPIKGLSLGGRNNTGRIMVRGRMGHKHRRQYRIIDFKRTRTDPATVVRLEYDPNRSAFIALLRYTDDGALSYILAPRDLDVGDVVQGGEGAPFTPGNAFKLGELPDGTRVHNIEFRPGMGGKMMRSAGCSAKLQSKDEGLALLRLQSGEVRKVSVECKATVGIVSNENHQHRVLGKAGASAWVGRGPKVRGVAMNPVDHPMGGGEGKSSGGRRGRVSPWGKLNTHRTRDTSKFSSRLIMRRRNHEKLGLSNVNKGSW